MQAASHPGMAAVFVALDDETRRLILDELFRQTVEAVKEGCHSDSFVSGLLLRSAGCGWSG